MIKQIATALAGLALAMPGQARIESGTTPLLQLLGSSGIVMQYNTDDCNGGEFLGVYIQNGLKRSMLLCSGATVDAEDHMVVRHETIHAIQHCVNAARGTAINTPVIDDDEQLMAFATEYLSQEAIEEIMRVYPREMWRVEFEAFAGMHAYSADELADMFTRACIYTED